MLYMGALHKETNKHINPRFAIKEDKHHYICPDCKRSVIFRNGKIKRPHFAHKSEGIKCNYYDKPSESEIHKEAKFLMSHILNERIPITFKKLCECCDTSSFYHINYTPNSKAVNEHSFIYNNSQKYADVALLDNDKLDCIIEICHTNATKEGARPEPWFEIDATNFIHHINDNVKQSSYELSCMRRFECDKCITNRHKTECNMLLSKINNIRYDIEKNKTIFISDGTEFELSINNIINRCDILENNINDKPYEEIAQLNEEWIKIKENINEHIKNESIEKYKEYEIIINEHKNNLIKNNHTLQNNKVRLSKLIEERNNIYNKMDMIKNKNKILLESKNQALKRCINMIKYNNNIMNDAIQRELACCYYCSLKNFSDYFKCIIHKSRDLLNNSNNFICIKCNSIAIKLNYPKNYCKKACDGCFKGCKICIKGYAKEKNTPYYAYFYIKCKQCDNSYSYDYIFNNIIHNEKAIKKLNDKWELIKNNTFKTYDYMDGIDNNINIDKLQEQNNEQNNMINILREEINNINIYEYDIDEYNKMELEYNNTTTIIDTINNENIQLNKIINIEQQKYDYIVKIKNELRAPQIIRENLSESPETHIQIVCDPNTSTPYKSTILNPSIIRKQSKISIPVLYQKYGAEKLWSQNLSCTICGRKKYSPYYDNNNRKYYAICKICYDESNNIILDSPKRKYINKAPDNLYKCDFID